MKKPTWTIFLLTLFTLGSFAQTPEWTEYCQIRDEINHNDYPPEIAYGMYCKMDSIYNGIPHFTDLYNFLSTAVACNEQEKTKELAFRIVRWKCWDSRFFNQPKLEAVKQMDFWPKLDSLSQANGEKKQYTDYMLELYEMRISDQQCRQALHGELTREESDSVWRIIHHTDSLNLNRLKELIAEYGFPTWEKVSYDYALCAWLVAQHADSAFLHMYVEQLKKAVADNNANPANLAYMIDRDLMNRNLTQLYGTQFIGVYNDEGVMENMLWPVENMEQLNARREHMLLPPMDTTGLKIYELDRDIRFLH